jgi:hypothetical protein
VVLLLALLTGPEPPGIDGAVSTCGLKATEPVDGCDRIIGQPCPYTTLGPVSDGLLMRLTTEGGGCCDRTRRAARPFTWGPSAGMWGWWMCCWIVARGSMRLTSGGTPPSCSRRVTARGMVLRPAIGAHQTTWCHIQEPV